MLARRFLSLVCALALTLALAGPGSAKMIRKIDNFFLVLDGSGSMGGDYGDTDTSAYVMARNLAERMNGRIPELGYKAGLAKVANYKLYQPLEPYSRSSLATALANTPEDVPYWFGNTTPLGKGLEKLEKALPADKAEKTAVILFSDGGQNEGADPVAVAKAVNAKFNGNVCFHVVSYAESPASQEVLDNLAKIGGCSSFVARGALAGGQGLDAFVKRVFYYEMPDAPPPPGDKDGDGVTDDKDACPGTPKGAPVDAVGCPLDSDGDGVYDYEDACPGTPAGLSVDSRGCPVPVTMELDIQFDLNKADIKPMYHQELAAAAEFLKTYPDTTAEIGGHTDSSGAADYNQQLSQKRADSVMRYLVKQFGIDQSRLTARGYGESNPLVPNDTRENRQRNRRTEVVVEGAFLAK